MEMMDTLVDGSHELFDYNRENFMFDQEQNIEREYQEQDMRVKSFVLYREDIRDLVELTTGKMDAYLPPIIFQLGICFLMLVHGELDGPGQTRSAPGWLFWLYTVNLAETFLYLFLAAWLCSHASVCAHSFGVRLLTQFVRLPVPNKTQLDAARRYAAEFEGEKMLRIPVVKQQVNKFHEEVASRVQRASEDAAARGSGDGGLGPEAEGAGALAQDGAMARMQDLAPNVLTLSHIRLYRRLQSNWQAHDAYCRACMALGTYTLVHSISYFIISFFVIELDAPGPAFCSSILLVSLAFLLVKLDLYFKSCWGPIVAFVMMSGPILAVICITLIRSEFPEHVKNVHEVLVPVIFSLQAGLIIGIVYVSRAEQVNASGQGTAGANVALPTRFRTVLYLDVFGWMGDPSADREQAAALGAGEAGPRAESAVANVMPRAHWQRLLGDCHGIATRAGFQLRAWQTENQACFRKIREITGLCDVVSRMNDRFDAIMAELVGISSTENYTENNFSSADGAFAQDREFWLRLSWNDLQYYVNSGTGISKSASDLPADAVISDLNELAHQMDTLCVQVQVLRDAAQQLPSQEDELAASRSSSSVSSLAHSLIPDRLRRGRGRSSADTNLESSTQLGPSAWNRQTSLNSQATQAAWTRQNSLNSQASVDMPNRHSSDSRLFTDVPVSAREQANNRTRAVTMGGPPLSSPVLSRAGSRSSDYTHGSAASSSSDTRPVRERRGSTRSSHGAHSATSRGSTYIAGEPLLAQEEASSAQEVRFGGREAANLDTAEADGGALDTQGAAAQTFFPRQDGRRESSTPPGQVPWTAFLGASSVLVMVWIAGVLYYAIYDYNHVGTVPQNTTNVFAQDYSSPSLVGAHLAFSADSWPEQPTSVHAVGLACDASLGNQVIVAAQYGVYKIELDAVESAGNSSSGQQAAPLLILEMCLGRMPAFHSEGLRGISLECTTTGDCSVLLLGMAGTQVLKCPLSEELPHGGHQAISVNLADSTSPLGWESIAAGERDKGGTSHWWGLPREYSASPRKLAIQLGKSGRGRALPVAGVNLQISPRRDRRVEGPGAGSRRAIRGPAQRAHGQTITAVRQLQAVQDHTSNSSALLGLSANGRAIHAWQIDRPESASSPSSFPARTSVIPSHLGSWLLPEYLSADGLCVTDKHLFIAGRKPGVSRGPEVWRFELPAALVTLEHPSETGSTKYTA